MDYGTYNRWLDHVHETGESLEDVIGYFENYNDDDSSVSEAGPQKKSEMLVAIGMVFKSDTIYAFARPEDDSLYIYHGSEWKPDAGLRMKSLIDRNPWKPAKGKPVMWTWIMYNQQGYFDGLQLEFAHDVSDTSAMIQLTVFGSEMYYREVSNDYKRFT